MGFEYKDRVDNVINALKDYNTTTSTPYLSQSLTSKLSNSNIISGNPEVFQISGHRLPALFVRISGSTEDYSAIGSPGPSRNHKEKVVIFDIIGLYPRQSFGSSESDHLDEIYNLARNIEAVFQQEYKLSNTALWVNPRVTDFQGPFGLEDGTLLKTCLVELEGRFHFR